MNNRVFEKISNLSKDDIETCHKYNFAYEIPNSLGNTNEVNTEIEDLTKINEDELKEDSEDSEDEEYEYEY